MFNGYGVYVYENGDIYAGTFENDEFNGQGRWSSVKKDFYEGASDIFRYFLQISLRFAFG